MSPDDQGRDPEVRHPQRRQHIQHAERQTRQHGQPQPDAQPTVTNRGEGLPQPLRDRFARCGHGERRRHQDPGRHRGARERGPGADLVGDRAHDRAEQRPADGRAHGRPDQLPASFGRRLGRQPGHATGPGARPAQSLDEPGGIEDRRRRGPPEDQRGHAHEGQPEQNGPAVTQVPGEQPARQRPDQRAQRVARHQDPRARLG